MPKKRSRFQIFTEAEIEILRRGGRILHDCLRSVAMLVRPGTTTRELDRVAETFIRDHGAEPGFQGYRGYPATLCTSANDVCVHGIPGDDPLQEGDIVGLDCGVRFGGLYTDACITVPVGRIAPETAHLLRATEEALQAGLAEVRAGARTGDVSAAIHGVLLRHGFESIRALTGHGLGTDLHQFPDIPNFGERGTGPVFPAGTIVAIEPISTAGSTDICQGEDGWTLRTTDGSLSAHFEHTVLVTDTSYEILT